MYHSSGHIVTYNVDSGEHVRRMQVRGQHILACMPVPGACYAGCGRGLYKIELE